MLSLSEKVPRVIQANDASVTILFSLENIYGTDVKVSGTIANPLAANGCTSEEPSGGQHEHIGRS